MRASEGQDRILPTLKLAFATANRLSDFCSTAGQRLPRGWSLTDVDPYDGSNSVLVQSDDEDDTQGFLVSEAAGALELHAVMDDRLVLLGRRSSGERPIRMFVLPTSRAA